MMSAQFLSLHLDNPQLRILHQAQAVLERGGVIVYPTDSGYALACLLGHHDAQQRIRQIRQVEESHVFSLVCRNLSEIGTYATVSNPQFRLLKANTPGAYTFILKATREVPKKLQHPKRSTIGVRVPDHTVTQAMLEALDEPLLSMGLDTLMQPHTMDTVTCEAWEIQDQIGHQVDLILDVGNCAFLQTTVINLTESTPSLIRAGEGDLAPFGLDDT